MRAWPGWAPFFLLLIATPAAALPGSDGPPGSRPCYYPSQLYTAARSDAPPAIRDAIASSHGQVAFRTCQDETGTRTYLRAPAARLEGVCRFLEVEVVARPGRRHGEGSLNAPYAFEYWNPPDGWEDGGPPNADRGGMRQFMAVGDGDCPDFDSPRYSWVGGVSAGLFRAIVALIGDLQSTPERFDALTANVPKSNHGLDRLRGAVVARHRMELFSVGDQQPEAQANAGGYDISLYDPKTERSYAIRIEFGAHGLEIRDAREPPLI